MGSCTPISASVSQGPLPPRQVSLLLGTPLPLDLRPTLPCVISSSLVTLQRACFQICLRSKVLVVRTSACLLGGHRAPQMPPSKWQGEVMRSGFQNLPRLPTHGGAARPQPSVVDMPQPRALVQGQLLSTPSWGRCPPCFSQASLPCRISCLGTC